MARRHLPRPTRRQVIGAVLLLCATLGLYLGAREFRSRATWDGLLEQVEAVEDVPEAPIYHWRSWSFDYQDTTITVTARYDPGELEQAREIDTSLVFGTRLWLREAYVSSLVQASSQSRFIGDLAQQFQSIRRQHELSDTEYVEVMARAVQAIPYGVAQDEILLPIEVIADGQGVCSEKSILLASLLVHEGFDTVVWVFETQGHAAVGVASNGATYGGSEYAFVETTRYAFVGQVSPKFASRGPIAKSPEMIKVGGEKRYTAGQEVAFILSQLDEAELLETFWDEYPTYAEQARVPTHKTRFAEHAEAYYDAAELTAYVMENTHDRAAIYDELLAREREVRPSR